MLMEEDGEDELPEKYRMSALKQLLCGDIRKHIDLKEQELKTYAEMRSAIMTWAVNKRLEKERDNGVQDMDCGRVAGGENNDAAHGGGTYGGQWPEDAGWMQGDINYMKGGYGKGYGKSFGGKGGGKFGGGKGGKDAYGGVYGWSKGADKGGEKGKRKEYSLEGAIIVEKRDTAQGFARSWEKEKEQMRRAKEKASKARVTIVVPSDIVPPTAGRAKAKEKEEHTQ